MKLQSTRFYFTGPIVIRRNIYSVIFKFNLIKSRFRVRLRLGLRVMVSIKVFGDICYGISYYNYTVQLHCNGLVP